MSLPKSCCGSRAASLRDTARSPDVVFHQAALNFGLTTGAHRAEEDSEGTKTNHSLAVDINAVDSNAVDMNAVDMNAVDINAVDINAVDINAVDINAVDQGLAFRGLHPLRRDQEFAAP